MASKKDKNPISITHPPLLREWDFFKNGNLCPGGLTFGSAKRVWWRCIVCGYSWQAQVRNRTKKKPTGCPACAGQVPNKQNSLVLNKCVLVEEWDFSKNIHLDIKSVCTGSDKKAYWICSKCGHGWESQIKKRALRGDGCPYCSGRRPSCFNNLVCKRPDLLCEWDYDKNSEVPEKYVEFSSKRVWWVCSVCKYSWESIVYNRTLHEQGCPYCSNKKPTKINNLKYLFPEISKEWDIDKNIGLSPIDVMPNSNKKVWWVCGECGYEWKAFVFNRSRGHGCPRCAGGCVSKASQVWLDVIGVVSSFREYYIEDLKIRVDGYDPETNTVYEFLGDFWHGNPEVFDLNDVNPVNKKPFGQLYEETLHRLRLLEEAGYNVVFIWEKDFKKEPLV